MTSARPSQPIQPPTQSRRAPRPRFAAPVRCPACYADLAALRPLRLRSVELAELAGRRRTLSRQAGDGRDLSSADLSRLLSTRRRRVSDKAASQQLAAATRDGLLRRRKLSGGPSGGFKYLYSPTPRAVAYVRDRSLALELARVFGESAERLQAALSVTLPRWWSEG